MLLHQPMSFSTHSRETVDDAWRSATPVPGTDSELWRQDDYGAWIHRGDYGNRHSQYGWEICENKGRCIGLCALQWQNYVDYCQVWDSADDGSGSGTLF